MLSGCARSLARPCAHSVGLILVEPEFSMASSPSIVSVVLGLMIPGTVMSMSFLGELEDRSAAREAVLVYSYTYCEGVEKRKVWFRLDCGELVPA